MMTTSPLAAGEDRAHRVQEVAGGRRGATCQSPVNHRPPLPRAPGQDDEEVLEDVDDPGGQEGSVREPYSPIN